MTGIAFPDYKRIWESGNLPWCALVTTGRVGSDFFQSLLDDHPEIFGFNGHYFFHEFWETARTTQSAEKLKLEHVLTEYIGHFIHKFKSVYDAEERMNELGEQRNQSIDVDLESFRTSMIGLLSHAGLNRKNFLKASYIAWSLALGDDISQKKIFFHHVHNFDELYKFLGDYPKSKVVAMTRDPRASYVSGVEHWRNYRPSTDHGEHVLGVLKRSIIDVQPLKRINVDYRALRLEDLGSEEIIRQVCTWLGVEYHDCLKQSTFGGLRWWSDNLSKSRLASEDRGYSPSLTENNWQHKLGYTERAILNFLLNSRLKWYGYSYLRRPTALLLLPMLFAILLPTRYERRLLSPSYLAAAVKQGKTRWFLASFYCYGNRIVFFYHLLVAKVRGQKFTTPFFRIKHQ